MPASKDSNKPSARKLSDDERVDVEARIEGLRAMGMPSSSLAADVYEDVLDGKVDLDDVDAEMAAREGGA